MSNVIFERYKDSSFENYICETKEQKELVSYLLECCNKKKFDRNIVIMGSVGIGKTHLAYAIMNLMLTKKKINKDYEYYSNLDMDYNDLPVSIQYTSIKEMIDKIKNAWNKKENTDLKNEKDCDLLIVDEIGIQYGSDMERIEMFDIFNHRYNKNKATLVISNLNKSQIYEFIGLRIADRIFGNAKIFEIKGKSKR